MSDPDMLGADASAPARQPGRAVGSARYKAIAEQLRADIRGGAFPVGGLLPTEQALGTRFGVGRHTVRDAVRVLVEDGLVLRRPGEGTKVVALGRQRRFVQTISNFDQWVGLPDGTTRRNASAQHIVADAELASTIHCQHGAALFHIRSLRIPRGAAVPIHSMDIYVPPRLAGIAKLPDHLTVPIHEQIEREYGLLLDEVAVDMLARPVPPDLAALFATDPATPAMVSVRRFLTAAGETLLATVSVYPADRVGCTMRFRRDAPNR